MIQTIFGIKSKQSQLFLEDGTRIPVTSVVVSDLPVVQIKTKDKDGYASVQIGIGERKKKSMNKALLGHVAKANIASFPKKLVEIKIESDEDVPGVGTSLVVGDILKAGDIVDVTGISKGKGFAGGVKRHHFRGGPRTHGQSDRERAPGSLGQTTTPGRVYKGKRMAGRMGQDTVTLQNLVVVAIENNVVYIKGLVPGTLHTVIQITKTGESKNFVAPISAKSESSEAVASIDAPLEETKEEGAAEAVASVVEEPQEVAVSEQKSEESAKEEHAEK